MSDTESPDADGAGEVVSATLSDEVSSDADGAGEVVSATLSDTVSPDADGAAYGWPSAMVHGQRVIHPTRTEWATTAQALLADGWDMCVDVTAVDYASYQADRELPAEVQPERFEVVASFVSYERRERMRARIQIPESDPTIDSIYPVYPGIDFQEREVYDLFGIVFEGHPDLSRILMPESWDGHPLRKDYAVGSIPVQFKAPGEQVHH